MTFTPIPLVTHHRAFERVIKQQLDELDEQIAAVFFSVPSPAVDSAPAARCSPCDDDPFMDALADAMRSPLDDGGLGFAFGPDQHDLTGGDEFAVAMATRPTRGWEGRACTVLRDQPKVSVLDGRGRVVLTYAADDGYSAPHPAPAGLLYVPEELKPWPATARAFGNPQLMVTRTRPGSSWKPQPCTALVDTLRGLVTTFVPVLVWIAATHAAVWAWFVGALEAWWTRPTREAAARAAELAAIRDGAVAEAEFAEEHGMLVSAAVWRELAGDAGAVS